MTLKNNKIQIVAGETEPYINVLLSNVDALKAFNSRFQPFELVDFNSENDSERAIDDEKTICDALEDCETQFALSIGYVPQDFLLNLQEITVSAFDRLSQSLESDRDNVCKIIQKWAVKFTNHYDWYYNKDMPYYDAINDFVEKQFDELKNEGYDVPAQHKDTKNDMPQPKFRAGDIVWYMFLNEPKKGQISDVKIQTSIENKPVITYLIPTAMEKWFPEHKVFASCDELLNSLRR